MTPNEYVNIIKQFVVYPKEVEQEYLLSLYLSEIGEVAGVYGKKLRGDYEGRMYDYLNDIKKELGDVCFAMCMIVDSVGGNCDEEANDIKEIPAGSNIIEVLLMAVDLGAWDHNPWDTFTWLLNHFDFTISEVMEANVAKLQDRANRGVIMGSGNNR